MSNQSTQVFLLFILYMYLVLVYVKVQEAVAWSVVGGHAVRGVRHARVRGGGCDGRRAALAPRVLPVRRL